MQNLLMEIKMEKSRKIGQVFESDCETEDITDGNVYLLSLFN